VTPALEQIRPQLRLCADAQVRVVFEGESRVPLFECDACEELLLWQEDKSWWRCDSCGYEMTTAEARGLLNLAIRRLRLIREDVWRKQGKRRGWLRRLLDRLLDE